MKWLYRETAPELNMNQWIAEVGFSPLFAAGLWNRGLLRQEQLEHFFCADSGSLLSPGMLGSEMEKAVARLRQAFERHEKIVIFGDYDVDGTSGAA